MASIRKGKQKPFEAGEIDAIIQRSRLSPSERLAGEDSNVFDGHGEAVAGENESSPPPLIGGVHHKENQGGNPIPAPRKSLNNIVHGGTLICGVDGRSRIIPLQRPIEGQKTVIDYVSFTCAESAVHRVTALDRATLTDEQICEAWCIYIRDAVLCHAADIDVTFKHGLFGYSVAKRIGLFGLVAAGSDNNGATVYVQLSGHAFAVCDDEMPKRLKQLIDGIPSAHLTRIDIAYDDMNGKLFPLSGIKRRWKNKQFNSINSPGLSKYEVRGDWARNDPDRMGRTVYIGSRSSGKLIRIYEKGRELGGPESEWVRVEVELSHSIYQLNSSMLVNSSSYFVAICPAFAAIAYQGEANKIERQGRTALIEFQNIIDTISTQYGAYLHVLRRDFYANDDKALLDAVCRNPGKVPDNLKRIIELHDAASNAECGI